MAIVAKFEGGTVTYHANQYGWSGLDEGTVEKGLHRIPPADEYWFHYWVRPETPWIEGLGYKMPGLAGGRATSGGAQIHEGGWSSRIMGGDMRDGLREYRYDQDREGRWGTSIPWRDGYRYLDPGRWTRIVQWVKINDPDRNNGAVKFWMNGTLVEDESAVRWRGRVGREQARVDRVRIAIIRGGNTIHWSVPKETRISYSDFYVLDCAPDMSTANPQDPPKCKDGAPELKPVAVVELVPGSKAEIKGDQVIIYG